MKILLLYISFIAYWSLASTSTTAVDIYASNLTTAQGFKITGGITNDWVGYSVSSAGDINGDGIDDIIVGAEGARPAGRINAGSVYVIFGSRDGLPDIDLNNTLSSTQ